MLLFLTNHFFLVINIFLLGSPLCFAARSTPQTFTPKQTHITVVNQDNKWIDISGFFNSQKGSQVLGLSKLKKYFHRFGYLPSQDYNVSDNTFDPTFESAGIHYQSRLGLPVTGKLEFETVSKIMAARCGVPDFHTAQTLHATKDYVFFPGKPRWARHVPMKLTYAFSKEYLINYLKISDIKVVFKRAFGKWASVIPVSFIETDDYGFADIRIGFYSGDHGDGEPFDGVLGVLAHSFSPESGKFHLDAAETWAIDFEMEKSPVAVDLESVAIHEIGHLLGLAHSPNKEAVMYATLKPRDKKVDLALDDIQGVQALYGSNPNFTFGSLLESDISTNPAVNLRIRWFMWATLILLWFLMFM
ncbi:metalloendoproteinase 4-MMP-like [Pistacia vera]|uniref:metalloendoproteinase 4-MMP-like n=1 Tax=Pistacia vera TaxID=55513 RepID=UPI0012634A29|nr:metalloendoproteinase 4-MMP-like [Pistacia vera]